MDDSAIICDEVIDACGETKTIPTNFNEKKVTCKTQNFIFLLIVLALLTAVSIYCCLIKYQAKQKHLLSFRDTKLKQVYINNIN